MEIDNDEYFNYFLSNSNDFLVVRSNTSSKCFKFPLCIPENVPESIPNNYTNSRQIKHKLIGLCGYAFSGKDSSCRDLDCNKLAFAGRLKSSAKILFDLTDAQLHSPKEKELIDPRYGLTPRQILQRLGTDFCRDAIAKNFHVDRIRDDIIRLMKEDKPVILTASIL